MDKIRFNEVGFIICLFCPRTKDKVYFFADVMEWRDAYNRAINMLRLKAYKDFGILSITRTLKHSDNEKDL